MAVISKPFTFKFNRCCICNEKLRKNSGQYAHKKCWTAKNINKKLDETFEPLTTQQTD